MTVCNRVREPAEEPDEFPGIAAYADEPLAELASEPGPTQEGNCNQQVAGKGNRLDPPTRSVDARVPLRVDARFTRRCRSHG